MCIHGFFDGCQCGLGNFCDSWRCFRNWHCCSNWRCCKIWRCCDWC